MNVLDDTASRLPDASASASVWRTGALNDEEFERAALVFQPSWEVGLDARFGDLATAPLDALPAEVNGASGFTAAPTAVSSELAGAASVTSVSLPPPSVLAEPSVVVSPSLPGDPVVEARPKAPVAKVEPRRATVDRPSRPMPRTFQAPPAEIPKARGSMGFIGAALGAVLVVCGAVYAFSAGSSASVTQPSVTVPPAPAVEPVVPPAPAPEVAPPAPPAPAVAALPEPAPAPPVLPPTAPPPDPPPAPVVAAPEPPPAPVVAAPAAVVRPARVRSAVVRTAPVSPVSPRRPSAAPTRGVGFVTESPY